MQRNHTISIVLSDTEKALIGKLKATLEKRTGMAWPITQIARFAIKALATQEKVK